MPQCKDIIKNASTLDEALENCLRGFVEHSGAQGGVLWYANKTDDNRLRPFFWIGPVDLASRSHLPGDGAVGRVFESQQAERLFDFNALMDVETAIDFAGLPVKSMVCVPFSSKNENLGVVQFVNGKDINVFSIKDARHYISYDNIALTAIGIIVGILLGIIMGSITVASIEPITSVFIKSPDGVAILTGILGSAFLAIIMSLIALRRINKFDLTDINRF